MTDILVSKLDEIQALVKERSAQKKAQEAATEARKPPARPTRKSSGRGSGNTVIAKAHEQLDLFAHRNGLDLQKLFPSSEFPTPLTRLPLFPPVKPKTSRKLASKEDWIPLRSPWDKGGVFKTGPALTVYDEDTLIGLLHLRSQRISGPGSRLPIVVKGTTRTDGRVDVHALTCQLSQLETAIQGRIPENGWGGRELKLRRESLDRLAGVSLKFTECYGVEAERGFTGVRLLSLQYDIDGKDGAYYVQFDPVISMWLDAYRSYIDLRLRRTLTPLGKAVHRFLASQRSNGHYSIELLTLFKVVGADGHISDFKRGTIDQLDRMREGGFIASHKLTGTGRKTLWMLSVEFQNAVP